MAKPAQKITEAIEDLTGQSIPLGTAIPIAAVNLLTKPESKGLGYSQFNELLLYLGYDRVSHAFFQFLVDETIEYKSGASIRSYDQLRRGVDEVRKVALLFFGNTKYGFKQLSRSADFLINHLRRFDKRREKNFHDRHSQILPPETIDGEDTYYLGYVIQQNLAEGLKKEPHNKKLLTEEKKRREIVERGKRNHDSYLVSDHLDVYIATSMRERHEFRMVHRTVRDIFAHKCLSPLNLRYFDPTQAYCMDRIDKGLAEGLMLKRAKCTVYFAQESDTFGKDSELASTLAQGKPVIAYVPKPEPNAATKLVKELMQGGMSLRDAVLGQLQIYQPDAAWKSAEMRRWIDGTVTFGKVQGVSKLQNAMERHFERRNKMLRETHPLGIQVFLRTGVANGVLVANTIDECARLVRGMLLRELEFYLEAERKNGGEYIYLKERISRSIFRVVTGDKMLTNAFWNFYLNPSE